MKSTLALAVTIMMIQPDRVHSQLLELVIAATEGWFVAALPYVMDVARTNIMPRNRAGKP